ncbi:MAG: hypothetical protein DBX39_05880 [Bacillota bacterium]|nr:MAG: hypothetical protein DBX39_05880 [Bacillota bacterium]
MIVIAVIAILAAVLIPTFTTLIDRANRSSDESAVYNMNLILSSDEAMNGKPENVSQAMDILSEAGMDAREYRALAKNHTFFYNLQENRVMYIDTTTYEISYPGEYAGTNYADFVGWYNLEGRMAGDDSWKTGGAGVAFQQLSTYTGSTDDERLKNAISTLTGDGAEEQKDVTVKNDEDEIVIAKISTAEKLISVVDYIEADEKNGEGFTVILGDDVDLKNSEWKPVDEFAGSFYGNGKVIDNLQMTDITADSISISAATTNSNYTFYGFISIFSGEYFGDVIFSNVVIDQPGSGYISDEGMNTNNHTAAVAIGAVYAEGDKALKTTIDKVTVGGMRDEKGEIVSDGVSKIVGYNRTAGVVGYVGGRAMTDKDKANKHSSVLPKGSSVTIQNCVNYATVESAAASYSSYATAGGILSITNQRGENTLLKIYKCQNRGVIRGQWVGGIMADSWASNTTAKNGSSWTPSIVEDKTSMINGETYACIANSGSFKYNNAGKIVIENCDNYGNLVGRLKISPNINKDNKPDNISQSIMVGGIFGHYTDSAGITFGSKYSYDAKKGEWKQHVDSREALTNYRVEIKDCENYGEISYENEYENSKYTYTGTVVLGKIAALQYGEKTNTFEKMLPTGKNEYYPSQGATSKITFASIVFNADNFEGVDKTMSAYEAKYYGAEGVGGIFLTNNTGTGELNGTATGNTIIIFEGTTVGYSAV